VIRKLVSLALLGRAARMGPLGVAVTAYTLWRRLSPKDQERVRRQASLLVKRVRSRASARNATRLAGPASTFDSRATT
jgi:hypothetical protein